MLDVTEVEQPELAAWRGLKLFASKENNEMFNQNVVTRDQYEEEGA